MWEIGLTYQFRPSTEARLELGQVLVELIGDRSACLPIERSISGWMVYLA
jgi:hypothetical protein